MVASRLKPFAVIRRSVVFFHTVDIIGRSISGSRQGEQFIATILQTASGCAELTGMASML